MNTTTRFTVTLAVFSLVIQLASRAATANARKSSEARSDSSAIPSAEPPFGIRERVPWTTSRIIGTPEPPPPYRVERVFPKLTFTNPVEFAVAPGSSRFYLAELDGKVWSFPNDPSVRKPDLFLDGARELRGARQLYGLEFHPKYQENHYVYVCYVQRSGLPDGSIVSRFKVRQTDPPRVDAASEVKLITWLSGGHNGGSLKFGPDGFLYISTGDAASPNPPDPLKTGQDNSDLLSAILRIDVDQADDGQNYRVPANNPFAGLEGTRPEIWAFGFRNPWRMSFDRESGDLWAGDVGWELWEIVFRVERGGNYGWSIVEGPQSINSNLERGETPILPPVKAHPHSEAASITGGFVYNGTRLNDLKGAYVYGDWVTGKIWGLRHDGNQLTSIRELVDTPMQIICFGEDHSGELHIVDYAGGIYRLEENPPPPANAPFPKRLSETGLFGLVQRHKPAPGVLPFLVNAEMWQDHAQAERFVALPGKSAIQTGARDVWIYQSKNEWRYPTNSVLAKTLSLEVEAGNPRSARRVETQLLHFDGSDWHAYTYRWNEAQDDANLVGGDGGEQVFEVKDANAPDGYRRQVWRFHSRTECLRCHNPWMNYALAFTASQLNRDAAYRTDYPVSIGGKENSGNEPAVIANQLRTFSRLGYFNKPLDARVRPILTNPRDATADINERARSWLHVNCAHCHREGAGGAVVSHFDYDTPVSKMKAVGQLPSQGSFGLPGARVIAASDPYRSALYYRISTTGQGRMPRIGSRFVDEDGARLIHDWIRQFPEEKSEDRSLRKARSETAETLAAVTALGDELKRKPEMVDRLLNTPNGALALLSTANRRDRSFARQVAERAASHPTFQARDLFERFLPYEQRVQKLGSNIDAGEILALKGDAARGRRLFLQEGTQCSRCHQINGEGTELGPDLSRIRRKYSRAQILDNILFPSRIIEPNFISYHIETKDEFSYSGFVLSKSEEEIVLKDATAKELRIPRNAVVTMEAQSLSVMPELLLQDMTARDAADLLEYLSSPP